MLSKVLDWLSSELNVFSVLGCVFDITESPEYADMQSITVDFELNDNLCRLIFWETGSGHIEVIEIDSEKTLIDESFSIESEFSKENPFMYLAKRLRK